MLLSRSPKRTNWHIQWVNLFFWPLWRVWQYWSLPPFWTFCNSLFSLTLHLNSLPVLLLFLYFSFSVSFTSSLFLLCPPLNVDVKKKMLMSARVQLWPFFFSSHYVLASANTYMLISLKSVWSPDLFWSLDPHSQLPAGQLHLDDSWAISNSVYPTHRNSSNSNQSMLPISLSVTTIHSHLSQKSGRFSFSFLSQQDIS